jgi:hypothetical protein
MAKTLNQFLESYLKVKNPDEQKFVDKHVVAKHSDRNGNDDEVFKGSKVKPIDRRKDRKGYNPGEDEKVYEELKGNQHKLDHNKNGKLDAHDFKLLRKKKKVAEEAEQIDELSTKTLRSYRSKRAKDRAGTHDELEYHKRMTRTYPSDNIEDREKAHAYHNALRKDIYKMSNNISRASAKIKKANEEAEQVEESAMFGKRVHNIAKHYGFSHDGKNSSAHGKTSDSISHFNGGSHWGHSDKSGRTIATGSSKDDSLSKHLEKHGYKLKEEAEQIDELSKETKASYMKKAGAEIDKHWDKSKTDARSAYKYYGRKNTMKKIANEEVEELDELSNDTLRSYRMKAKSIADHGGKQRTQGRELAGRKSYGGRMAGIEKAKVMAKEEAEQIDETAKIVAHLQKRYGDNIRKSHVMSAAKDFGVDASKLSKAVRTKLGKNMLGEKLDMDKASMGDVITDFKDSNAPQFKGKSQDKRRVMAIAAKLTAERGGKPLRKEEKLANLLDDLTESHRRTMLLVFDKLNEDNQKKFLEACQTEEGVESMLDFSISHRGE